MKNLAVNPGISIRDALKNLDRTGERCLLVVSSDNKFLGTLTDGDIRRAILNGKRFSESISTVYNPNSVYIDEGYDSNALKEIFLKNKFDVVPVVGLNGKLIGYKTWEELFGNGSGRNGVELSAPVIIMAGGSGTRLEPFTKILPKPLIPINEKPVIEHIIEKFTGVGCKEFFLTVNYKGRILKAYFEELAPEYSISFIEEPKPLGTAGSLSFLKGQFAEPFFVTNCDIIIKADYRDIYNFHMKNHNDITLVASAKEYTIPYGTCELDVKGNLSLIKEKPSYDLLINTGLYILNHDMLDLIPDSTFFHITQLIERANNSGKRVGVYPVDDDSWVDVGQWAEYKKAVEKL